MVREIDAWEDKLAREINDCLSRGTGSLAGALLPVIPNRASWEDFRRVVRADWPKWRRSLNLNPHCLVILFCGLAFFEYEHGGFWSKFSEIVSGAISAGEQTAINQDFAHCLCRLGPAEKKLTIRTRPGGADYVGSAIYYAGIPLDLWDDFIAICHWALWNDGWEGYSDEKWRDLVGKRCGGHNRLKRFVVENRELGTTFIREMVNLRNDILKDPNFTLNSFTKNTLIRREYLEEVPETAEFLLPRNPDRLNKDRVSLALGRIHGDRHCVYLRVPAVPDSQLPAQWEVKGVVKPAGRYPDRIPLDAKAFTRRIDVRLVSQAGVELNRWLPVGLDPWGLFDMGADGTAVNANRKSLPTGEYWLLSRTPLDAIKRTGFCDEDYPSNEPFVLSDDSQCFLTRLEPCEERARVSFCVKGGASVTVNFRPRERIECYFLPCPDKQMACFRREGDVLFTRQMPAICVSVPPNFFDGADAMARLESQSQVTVRGTRSRGEWKRFLVNGSDRDYFRWEWADSDKPLIALRAAGGAAVYSFQELESQYDIPKLAGVLAISVESPEFSREWKINKEPECRAAEAAWSKLPGDFLLMVLLSQSPSGMRWEEIVLARNAVQPGYRIERDTLNKYVSHGFVKRSGAKWCLGDSRVTLQELPGERVQVDYCGDSGKLWSLYNGLHTPSTAHLLPMVEVVAGTADLPPFLRMVWPMRLRDKVESYLCGRGVKVGDSLWNH